MSDGYLAWHRQEEVAGDVAYLLRSGIGPRSFRPLPGSREYDTAPVNDGTALLEAVRKAVRLVPPYTWNAAMTNLLIERAADIQYASLRDLPSPAGFAWFDKSINGMHGWFWAPQMSSPDQPDNAPLIVIGFGRQQGHWVPILSGGIPEAMVPPWADELDIERLFAASIALLSERITFVTRQIPRSMLSKQQRRDALERRPIVRVVELRTITRVVETGPVIDQEHEREYHYQFMVRAHQRKIRNPETGETRLVPVRAHRKGPTDAPWLRPQTTIFHVDR